MQGTITFGIHYAAGTALNLLGFTDSDWAGDNIDCMSTSRYLLRLGFGPICWSSKKQVAIALSSAEAEYRGAVNITIQISGMRDPYIDVCKGGESAFESLLVYSI